ncbi:ABC-three component system protein [Pseudomonas protegens]|uniref:ABC-three component system protein n=1 Tax=Pseudomonas protegens TaxID=380021 RepID=UPI00301CC0F1
MIRRFRLEQKGHYEKLVIAQRLADMLDCFIEGRPAPIEMGSEQGGIPKWDDFVVLHADNTYEHVQIKRQSTDFCTKNANKPSSNDKLSVIDDAFTSLAEWIKSEDRKQTGPRKFVLSLASIGLHLKKDLTVNHLDEVCTICRQDWINPLAPADRKDGPTQRVYTWLTTWCGFTDWAHIKEALQLVTIMTAGIESNLKEQAVRALDRHFTDAETTLNLLLTYISAETSDISAIRCRSVLRHLHSMRRPDMQTWTQYRMDSASKPWCISGTHDVQAGAPEPSGTVVQQLWGEETRNRKLRVAAAYSPSQGSNLTLPYAILRLALHLQGATQGFMLGATAWRTSVGLEVGHTLGIGECDLDTLPWFENADLLSCAAQRELDGVAAARLEAQALTEAMDDAVWQRVVDRMSENLAGIGDAELLDAMETTWQLWRAQLTEDKKSRRQLLEQMLYPSSEGKNAVLALRLGPRTVNLLATAIETLLLVAVAIGGEGSNWKMFTNCGEVLSIALKQWSGPATEPADVRELSADSLLTVIGPSPAPVVILAGVEASPASLLEEGMADDADETTSMAAERRPQLLVTRFKAYQLLRKGTLENVRAHFGKQWRDRRQARDAAIESNGSGA